MNEGREHYVSVPSFRIHRGVISFGNVSVQRTTTVEESTALSDETWKKIRQKLQKIVEKNRGDGA